MKIKAAMALEDYIAKSSDLVDELKREADLTSGEVASVLFLVTALRAARGTTTVLVNSLLERAQSMNVADITDMVDEVERRRAARTARPVAVAQGDGDPGDEHHERRGA